jgi:methyl-accepting chemotaxis protein
MKNMLNNLSLRTKLVGNSGILLALLMLSSGYAIYAMMSIGSELSAIAKQDIPLTEKVTAITTHQLQQTIQFERALYYGAILQQKEDAPARFAEAIKTFDAGTERIEREIIEGETIAAAAMSSASLEARKEFESVGIALKRIEKEHKEFVQHAHKVFAGFSQGQAHAAEQLAQSVEQEATTMNQELTTLLTEIGHFTATSAQRAVEHEHAAIFLLSVITAVSLLFGLLVSWLLANIIVKAIRKAIVTASGDLTQAIEIDSQDEVGELLGAMNGMRHKLLDMLSTISGTTAQLASAAEQMSVVTNQTSQTIQEQRKETEQVATAMNEMATTAQQIAVSISHTSSSAGDASEQANDGSRVVQQTIEQINKLTEAVEESAQTIGEVEQHSETISAVLDVIKGIADQTNLLALNAAIEAARAGEQGRGFAVVADEVRALAGRTQQSTNEINEMIGQLQVRSRLAVEVMERSREQVGSTVQFATQAGIALEAITQAVEQINEMSSQIASAAEQQGAVAEEINSNIVKISGMTNQTAEGAEETATASADLTRMASELQAVVGQFKV